MRNLFIKKKQAYELRDAGAVVHSHSLSAVAATLIQGEASASFKATHLEMCKGIDGHGFHSTVEVPIVENTARECELTGRLREAIAAYPSSNAVLVRRHGVYVWGSTWQRAKAQAETYDYLFEAALRLRQAAGVDVSRPPPGWKEGEGGLAPPRPPPPPPPPPPQGSADEAPSSSEAAAPAGQRPAAREGQLPPPHNVGAVVLDIEGTVLPISYVKAEMFPYARRRFRTYLLENYEKEEVQTQLGALREQHQQLQLVGASCPAADEGATLSHALELEESSRDRDHALSAKRLIVGCAVKYLEALTDADVKSTALKEIQGSIWHEGFLKGELRAPLFADVPGALARWTRLGIKVFIYSSGSKRAQIDLFAHTNVGDLSEHISGYFDTTSGAKVSAEERKSFFLEV